MKNCASNIEKKTSWIEKKLNELTSLIGEVGVQNRDVRGMYEEIRGCLEY